MFLCTWFTSYNSEAFDVFYKGYFSDPENRLRRHNGGKSRYTASKGEWKPVLLKSFDEIQDALRYEKMLKRQNWKYLEWLIKGLESQPVRIHVCHLGSAEANKLEKLI